MTHVIGFLAKGGFIIYPLMLCSVVGLAIFIEKWISLRHKKVIVPEIVNVINNIKGPGDVSMATSICEKHTGPFANIVRVGLDNRDLPKDEIKESLSDQGRQEVFSLERGLVVLETIAGIAPLLGLLGTVIGILKVFDIISTLGVGQARAMAGGISEALITTIVGLSIGIPALVGHNYFSSKAERLILEMEKHSTALIRKISGFRLKERSDSHAV